jgi:hypothetical protein
MPGKGRYTKYSDNNSRKKEFLNKLFPQDAAYKGSTYNHLDNAEARAAIVKEGNDVLHPSFQRGDPEMFPNGVNLDYSGVRGGATAPGKDHDKYVPTRPGDPMNAFVPDVSSPGVGETEGVEKDLETNPKYDPQKYMNSVDPDRNYVKGPGTRMPSAEGNVWKRNVLGSENKFDTRTAEQYPE